MNFDRVVLVAGTRPEFVKLHPVALALHAARVPLVLVVTNQHRSSSMRDAFLNGLRWPCDIEALPVESEDPLVLLSEILVALPVHLRRRDLVLAEGDTTSVLAAHIVANKLRLRVAHLEAGLRSYDLRMPEEHNRRVCDHLADDLFAPTGFDAAHLREEHVLGDIHVVGNTVLDAVRLNAARLNDPPVPAAGEILLTVHRQENVDDPAFLAEMVAFLERIDTTCVFPVHPRTLDKLRRAELWDRVESLPHVRLTEPLDYLSFLAAMRSARVVVTDSGGVQEEATAPEIRRPAVVIRKSTERVPAIQARYSVLSPPVAADLLRLVTDLSWFAPSDDSPFGDGHAAERVVRALAGTTPPAN